MANQNENHYFTSTTKGAAANNYNPPSLITTFTPPASCLEPPIRPTKGSDGYLYHQWSPTVWSDEYAACYPPRFRQAWASGLERFYSPGICPLGYEGLTTMSVVETRALCCLSGWTTNSNWNDYCYTMHNDNEIWAPGVSIRWKDTDSAAFAIATRTESLTSGAPTETGEVEDSSDGLSTGAKIGIGLGVAIPVLAILAAIVFFFLRRRKRTQQPSLQQSQPTNYFQDPNAEKNAVVGTNPVELDSRPYGSPPELEMGHNS